MIILLKIIIVTFAIILILIGIMMGEEFSKGYSLLDGKIE